LQGQAVEQNMRYVSGSVLSGTSVGCEGSLRFYDSQVHVLPEVTKRHFLRFFRPGASEYSFSRVFASALKPENETSLNTDENGSIRAIVANDIYDKYVALDIYTYFLIKAICIGDWDEAERLGILECDEEDFALCTFACPSKYDVGGFIQDALMAIEKEG